MRILSPAGRRALRGKAHHLHPFVTIGQHGLTPAVLHEIDINLKAHELIKIRVAGDDRDAREETLMRICAELDAAAVQHIGKLLVVWRPAPKEEAVPASHVAKTGKSAAKKAPQSRRPRTPLPRTPKRPPPVAKRPRVPHGKSASSEVGAAGARRRRKPR